MRELEFLPTWYHQRRRNERIVVWQTWVLLALVSGLGTWMFLTHRTVRAAERLHTDVDKKLTQTRAEQQMLDEQLALKQQLQAQEELLASVGYTVEMTRVLEKLDSLMPKQMSLLEFDCTTEDVPRTVASVAAVKKGAEKPKQIFDRRLRVKILGVAPNNSDIAHFVAGLHAVPFFEQVSYVQSRDVYDAGHVLREFTVTFCVNLNP